jgi:SHS2 domain-containing protein
MQLKDSVPMNREPAQPVPRWEHFHHQADIGIRGVGRTREEAFAMGGVAFTAVMTDPGLVEQRVEEPLDLSAPGDDFLFLDFVNELVFLAATKGLLFSRFEVCIDGDRLTARIWGEVMDPARHDPAVEVKAASMNELRVRQGEDGMWVAQCVVDV